MDTLKDKAAKGFIWSALNSGTTQLLGAVFGIILGRLLCEDDYGLIGMINIFGAIANSLQESGFITALINRKDATHKDFNSVFWFNVSVSIFFYVVLFLCAPLIASFYNEPLLTSLSRYVFLGFLIASFSIVPRAMLIRSLRMKELALMGFGASLVSGIIGVTMAYNNMAYWGIATQALSCHLFVSVSSWLVSGWRPSFNVTFQPVKEMFGFSSKMLVTNIVNQVNKELFSVVFGRFYDKGQVGCYNQANKWNLMGTNTITGMVQGIAQPVFVQIGNDNERLVRGFRKMLRLTCFISFPAMLGLSLVASEFITILITEKWLAAARLMQMLCVAGAFLPVVTLYYNFLISRGKSNVYMWNMIAQCSVLLGAVLCVVHVFDREGLANSFAGCDNALCTFLRGYTQIDIMILSYVVIVVSWLGIWHWCLKREIGIRFRDALRDILPFMLVAAGSMIATYLITSFITNIYLLIVVRILLAASLYLGIMWLLGAAIMRECLDYIFKKKH